MTAFPPVPQQVTPAPIVPGLRDLLLGIVHAYLNADGNAPDAPLALVNTGLPGSAPAILGAVNALGRRPHDVRWTVATHLHTDHAGSLAELNASGAWRRALPPACWPTATNSRSRAGCAWCTSRGTRPGWSRRIGRSAAAFGHGDPIAGGADARFRTALHEVFHARPA